MNKPLKFDKILKYYNYISKLVDLSFDDVNELYEISNTTPLKEGIHTSFGKDNVLSIFKKRYSEYVYELDEDGSIYIYGELYKNFDDIIKLMKLCGWFPSNILVGVDWFIFKNNEIYNNITGLSIEPVKDVIILDMPKVLYHVSDSIYNNKIKKIGLIPKSKSKLSNHPDRIYLTDNLKKAIDIKISFDKMSFDSGENRNHSIWKIDSIGMGTLFSDINLRSEGYYTMSNISPNKIEKIKKFK